ncbi:hypothetical protein J4E85_003980 [Alternaria conjuncta]|uniref:uncharacterized protein n=1 Tax=Alternaria conjuncta TaxID=181017 RepID=UPI00221E394A|nr:uncharacterized protein J4E85_003980 [Alternaria conjuncta]KAI4931388.1 hypothetical protein J4E85_003980 [Alternaria conjuncta]
MAEVIGLAASIIQIAGAGAKLSVALYNFTNSAARADQDVKDIADDVELTSNALESVGRVFESEEAGSIVSKKAIQDANNIIKKCQSVFDEVSEIVEKRRKTAKDGKKSLSVMGKLAWPMKEQRVELNRRRLESLKNSLVLLLHVLQLAQGQARGKMEKGVLDEEREKIRELHQRQQDSLKSLQALENRFCHIAINDEETLRGSSVASRVPTLELMANAPVMELPPLEKVPKLQPNTITIELSTTNDSDTSDSDATMSGDDNEEQISTEELAKAADHVKKLLKRITMLQKSFDVDKKKHRKRHVHKMYQRFCRKFESGIKLPSAADFGKVAPFIDFDMNDNSGSLENFDFDSFLHVPDLWKRSHHLMRKRPIILQRRVEVQPQTFRWICLVSNNDLVLVKDSQHLFSRLLKHYRRRGRSFRGRRNPWFNNRLKRNPWLNNRLKRNPWLNNRLKHSTKKLKRSTNKLKRSAIKLIGSTNKLIRKLQCSQCQE